MVDASASSCILSAIFRRKGDAVSVGACKQSNPLPRKTTHSARRRVQGSPFGSVVAMNVEATGISPFCNLHSAPHGCVG
eukprot:scaffold835_cov202-Alexandrium_tamarense.AAC.13